MYLFLSARVIRVWDAKEDLVDSCLEETGGLGVDIILDSGGLLTIYMVLIIISTLLSVLLILALCPKY